MAYFKKKKRFNLQDGKVFKSLVNIKKVHVTDEEIIIPFYISDKCIHRDVYTKYIST